MDYIRTLINYISPSTSNPPWTPQTCTPTHILAAHTTLRSLGLPSELAYIILDYAEYWACSTTQNSTPLILPLDSPAELFSDGASSPYVETGPLAMDPNLEPLEFVKLRKVVFMTEAHDQGWASNMGERSGPYDGAHSWFEVCLWRRSPVEGANGFVPVRRSVMDDIMESRHQLQKNWICREPLDVRSKLKGRGWDFVPVPAARTAGEEVLDGQEEGEQEEEAPIEYSWLVQRNVVARNGHTKHVVEWRRDDETDGVDSWWTDDGAGTGRGFIESIKRGDRICVWARCLYPGWEHHVNKVVVETYFSI